MKHQSGIILPYICHVQSIEYSEYCSIKIIDEEPNLTVFAQIVKGDKIDYTQIIRTLLAAMGSAEELRQQLER